MRNAGILNIGMVSGADEIRLRSYVNHTIYAREHGLDYRLECGLAEGVTNKFFYKTHTVERLLGGYDWLIWLDDDVFITDFSRDGFRELIDQATQDGKFLVIAEGPTEPRGFKSTINTGVFILRNEPRSFRLLDLVHGTDLETVRAWWDDEGNGVFTHGDQDLMLWALETTSLGDGAMIVEHRSLNSRTHFYEGSLDDAFICHFCGHFDKKLSIVNFARRFGVGQELVPKELLDRYRARVRNPMSPAEVMLRESRFRLAARLKPYLRGAVRRFRAEREHRLGF